MQLLPNVNGVRDAVITFILDIFKSNLFIKLMRARAKRNLHNTIFFVN